MSKKDTDLAVEEPIQEKRICGHRNLHAVGFDQICDDPPGHDGLHHAMYKRLVKEAPNPKDNEYEDKMGAWSDGAGEPQREQVARHDIEVARLAAEKQAMLTRVKR